MLNKVLVYTNNSRKSLKVKESLLKELEKHNKEVVTQKPEAVIVIGGDGTMLSAIRRYRKLGIPFIGIDTGTLGFLNTVMPEKLDHIFDILDFENYSVERYPTISLDMVTSTGKTINDYAFNEVILRQNDFRLLQIKVYINGRPFNYFTGDGFVISTPIGCTGYAIWVDAAVIHSDVKAFQITPLAPNDNSVNRPMSTSMIVPSETEVRMEIVGNAKRKVAVIVDGVRSTGDFVKSVTMKLDYENAVEIIRADDFDYFDLYKRKIIDKNIRRKLGD